MPRKDFDLDGYFEELFKDSDLPAEQVEAAKAVLKQDAVSARLADGVLRQRDYSRQTQELASKRGELETFYQQLLTASERADAAVKAAEREKAAALQRAQSYESVYGPLDNAQAGANGNGNLDTSKFLTREEFEKAANLHRDQTLGIMEQLGSIPVSHFKEFGEVLNTTELIAEALKRQAPPRVVYEDMVRDRRAEKAQVDLDTKLKAARDEGFKAGASQSRVPSAAILSDAHPLDARAALGEKLPVGPAWRRAVDKLAAGGYEKEAALPERA